jgi:hypothetical protein
MLSRLLLAIALLRTDRPGEVNTVLAPILAANPADLRALLLMRRAAESAGRAGEAKRLSSELARIEKLGPVQYQAASAAVAALQQGRDLDPNAVNTTSGPGLPGSAP